MSSSSTTKELTIAEDSSFESFFRPLDDDSNVIRLFDRKGYYSVHGKDAMYLGQEYLKSVKNVKKWKSGLPNLSIRQGLEFQHVLKFILLEQRKSVEVYSADGRSWKVVRKASPGNLAAFEDELYGNAGDSDLNDAPVFMAVFPVQKGGETTLGVAFVDTTLKQIGVTEFLDNEQLANFESVLIQVGVRECCTIADDKSYFIAKLVSLLERCNVPTVTKKKSEFKTSDIEQDVKRMVGEKRFKSVFKFLDLTCATAALACLIAHLELLADDTAHGHWRFRHFDLAQYMRLDAAALKALNLVPTPDDVNQKMNLATYLDQTKTAMGSRLLHQMVKQPLMDIAEIRSRQSLVAVFYEETLLRHKIRDECLRGMPDVERLCRKLVVGRATLQDLCTLYQFSAKLPELVEQLQSYAGQHQTALQTMFVEALTLRSKQLFKYGGLIASAVDLELAAETHEFLIKASYSEALTKLAEGKHKHRRRMELIHEEVVDAFGTTDKKLKLEFSTKLGWYFRVAKGEEPKLRSKLKGAYAPFETSSAGVKFRGAELAKASSKWLSYQALYEEAQEELVDRVLRVAATYVEVFEAAAALVAGVDVFAAWAHVFASARGNYVTPTITEAGKGNIVLKEMRHPCLEAQDQINVIPNSVEFVRDKSEFHIITGPNMGGKSTYVRTVGVLVLMAQIGAMVPCVSASVCICDCILARVGAGDSQLRGVSTFMSEMLETASILSAATERSLIIIDELGRGTSTYDGFGLAWAISEHLCRNVRAFTFFATHFFELTSLAEQQPTVANYHVKAVTSNDSLVMLYRVEPGASDQSLGIHVAQMAKFPPEVVLDAKAKARELELYAQPLQAVAAASLQPSSAATDDDNDDNDAVEQTKKRAKTSHSERDEGLKLIKSFLSKFTSNNVVDRAAVQQELEQLKQENAFVADVCQRAASAAATTASTVANENEANA